MKEIDSEREPASHHRSPPLVRLGEIERDWSPRERERERGMSKADYGIGKSTRLIWDRKLGLCLELSLNERKEEKIKWEENFTVHKT